ncbi:MAG: phosphoglucosamine mutase [Saprospirales bacterium]|nr:phosphoglucosamine mutase [Saprospirales bacterium]
MTLIKSISGIRGTIGGQAGENLTAQDIVSCTAAFAAWMQKKGHAPLVVVGRDGRISGEMVSQLVIQTLRSMGISVVDLGLTTTPTVEIAVPEEGAGAGIIVTASHNPQQWNALKFLNHLGEFISAKDGEEFLALLNEPGAITYADVLDLGSYRKDGSYLEKHIGKILALPLVAVEAIRAKNFKIVVDGINSSGGFAVPALLESLGCEIIVLNGEPNGHFAHNPEPLPEHLEDLSNAVRKHRADLGIAVDPDVDRLAFVCEDGELFGEEYTLVAVADYVLKHQPGNTVSNLSSTRALSDVTAGYGGTYFASAVGEVNVVTRMKEVNAVIGGEGNGGVIYPGLHYGRDALAGIAFFLSLLAGNGLRASVLKSRYPSYTICKNKIDLRPGIDIDRLLLDLKERYRMHKINMEDGLKIDLDNGWIHLRKSNTEPIIRIYTESHSQVIAEHLAAKVKTDVNDILKGV